MSIAAKTAKTIKNKTNATNNVAKTAKVAKAPTTTDKDLLDELKDLIYGIPDNEYIQDFLKLIDENPRYATGIGAGAGALGGMGLGAAMSDDNDELLQELLMSKYGEL